MLKPPFTIEAIASYSARNEREVSLEKGKRYKVLLAEQRGSWYQTVVGGRRGWFPTSYSKIVDEDLDVESPDSLSNITPPLLKSGSVPAVQKELVSFGPADVRQQRHKSEGRPGKRDAKKGEAKPSFVMPEDPRPEDHRWFNQLPIPLRPPCIEWEVLNTHLRVQIIEAQFQDIYDLSRSCITAFLFRREVMDDGKGVKIFHTSTAKKTTTPVWNELFQLNVKDAEAELLCIRFVVGKKLRRKFLFGEVTVALRAAVRDFDTPHYKVRWYPISHTKGDRDTVGAVKLYLEYFDGRATSLPTNFKHRFGWNPTEGGFNVRAIPREWRQKFEELGIKPAHLKKNNRFSAHVLDIMQDSFRADQYADDGGTDPGEDIGNSNETQVSVPTNGGHPAYLTAQGGNSTVTFGIQNGAAISPGRSVNVAQFETSEKSFEEEFGNGASIKSGNGAVVDSTTADAGISGGNGIILTMSGNSKSKKGSLKKKRASPKPSIVVNRASPDPVTPTKQPLSIEEKLRFAIKMLYQDLSAQSVDDEDTTNWSDLADTQSYSDESRGAYSGSDSFEKRDSYTPSKNESTPPQVRAHQATTNTRTLQSSNVPTQTNTTPTNTAVPKTTITNTQTTQTKTTVINHTQSSTKPFPQHSPLTTHQGSSSLSSRATMQPTTPTRSSQITKNAVHETQSPSRGAQNSPTTTNNPWNLPSAVMELLGPVEFPPMPAIPRQQPLPPELEGYSSPIIAPELQSPLQDIIGSLYGVKEVLDNEPEVDLGELIYPPL